MGNIYDAGSNLVRFIGAHGKMEWHGMELSEYVKRSGNDETAADSCIGSFMPGPGNYSPGMAEGEESYFQESYPLLKKLPGVVVLELAIRFEKTDLPDLTSAGDRE
jgi:hypothetical protein